MFILDSTRIHLGVYFNVVVVVVFLFFFCFFFVLVICVDRDVKSKRMNQSIK